VNNFPVIPGYKIEKKIGHSNIAEVYLGVQEDLDRKVGIKVLNPEIFHDQNLVDKFLNEAKKDAKFVHANIANILEVGETGTVRYIVMEYLPESLKDIINLQFKNQESQTDTLEIERGAADLDMDTPQNQKLSERTIIDIVKQIARALDYAHKNGVVHKNIRPENIRFREDGTATIVDFFISKVLDHKARELLKDKGIVIGSPHYASPEKALRKPVDGKTDIYSLGVVFYEMLTGHVPYNAEETIAIENQHIMEPVPQLPENLKKYQPVLDRMMAKDLEERIATGTGVIRQLEKITDDFLGTWQQPDVPSSSTSSLMEESPNDNQQLDKEIPPMDMATDDFSTQEQEETPPMKSLVSPDEVLPIDESIPLEERIDNLEMQLEGKKPTQKRRTFTKSRGGFPSQLTEPKILIPAAAIVVIVVLLLIFVVKPFSSDEGGDITGQGGDSTQARTLTKEEQERIDLQYKHRIGLAKTFFQRGEFDKAKTKVEEAEKLKSTPESTQLAKEIDLKIAEQKDHNAYKTALTSGTSAAIEKYLQQFPSGQHIKEAEEKYKQFKKEEQKKEAQRKRVLAAMIKLRTKGKNLSRDDVKNMLINRGFFEKYYNKTGNFKNYYNLKTVDGGKIIVDLATGLIWHQSGSDEYMKYQDALQWIADLNQKGYAGYSNWRLPTLEEAASLLENKDSAGGLFIDKLFSRDQRYIWTSDTNGKDKMWVIDFFSGDTSPVHLTYNVYVRPVRRMD